MAVLVILLVTNMSVPLRSALKSPISRPDSPSLSTPFRIPSPPIVASPQSNEISVVSVLPESRSISSSMASQSHASSSSVNADTTTTTTSHVPKHQTSSPAPTYTPKVSFDTFENPVASMFSFTLQVKSEGYRRTRNTRVFLCASSPDESGREALEWSLESLVQEGDELIVFRGVDEDVLGWLFYLFFSSFIFPHWFFSFLKQRKIMTSYVMKHES